MKGVKAPSGYTIIEVLIVLAVSGVMFIMAANFIDGKNSRTRFQQGSNELGSRVQSVIEEITDGQYSDIPFTCNSTSSSITITGTPQQQGKNYDCIFIGKIIHFSVGGNQNRYE